MPSINHTALALLDSPDLLMGHFGMEMEEVQAVIEDYSKWLTELETEWPAERVKEWVLANKRDQYAKAAKYIIELERKNRDARAQGLSFKAREEKYGRNIRIGQGVLKEYEQEGRALKTKTFSVHQYVKPLDMPSIQRDGFEKHLKYAVF